MKAEIELQNLNKFISVFGSETAFLDRSVLKCSDHFSASLSYNENFSISFRPLIVRMETVRVGSNVIPTGMFRIIQGEDRLPLAYIYDSVPVIILDTGLSDSEVETIGFLMNLDVDDFSEKALLNIVRFGYEFILNKISVSHEGWLRASDVTDRNFNRRIIELLSELINMSTQNLYRYLCIIRFLVTSLVSLFDSGVLSLRSAYLLSKEPDDVQLCVYDYIIRHKLISLPEADAFLLCKIMKEKIAMSDEQKIKELEEQNALLQTELKNVKNLLAQERSKSKKYRTEILNAIDDDMRSGAGSYSAIPNLSTLLAIEDKFKSINNLASSLTKTIYKATSVGYDFHNRELDNLQLLINKFVGIYNDISNDVPLVVANESDVKESALAKKARRGKRES